MNATMPSPPSDETRLLFKVLSDGEWQDYEAVKAYIAQRVPPGRALRKYQNDIEARRRAKSDPSYDTPHSESVRIELGAKRMAQVTISAWRKEEKGAGIELRGTGSLKQIRIRPGFTPPWQEFESSEEVTGSSAEEQDPGFLSEGYSEVPQAEDLGLEVERAEAEKASEDQAAAQRPHPRVHLERANRVWRDDGRWVDADELPSASGHAETVEALGEGSEGFRLGPDGMVVPEGAVFVGGDSASSYEWPRLASKTLPECPECGLAVRDQARHGVWHEGFVKRSEQENVALLTISQVSDVCRDVMGQELENFQRGMQFWLQKQFAQLEAAINDLRYALGQSTTIDSWRASTRP